MVRTLLKPKVRYQNKVAKYGFAADALWDKRYALGMTLVPMRTARPSDSMPAEMQSYIFSHQLPKGAEQDPMGWQEAREAVMQYYADRYQNLFSGEASLNAENVMLATNASTALQYTFIIMSTIQNIMYPGYPAYLVAPQFRWKGIDEAATHCGLKIIEVPQDEKGAWDLEFLNSLRLKVPVAGLYRSSPGVPDGAIATAEETMALAQWCKAARCLFVEDLVKENFTGPDALELPLLAQYSDDGFIVGNTSYMWCSGDMNIGWLVSNKKFLQRLPEAVAKIHINPCAQLSILPAMNMPSSYHTARRLTEAHNNQRLTEILSQAGLPVIRSKAGMGVVTDISAVIGKEFLARPGKKIRDSVDFCMDLATVCGVFTDPCSAKAATYVRFAGSESIVIKEGGDRAESYMLCQKSEVTRQMMTLQSARHRSGARITQALSSPMFFRHLPAPEDRPRNIVTALPSQRALLQRSLWDRAL